MAGEKLSSWELLSLKRTPIADAVTVKHNEGTKKYIQYVNDGLVNRGWKSAPQVTTGESTPSNYIDAVVIDD